jgi:putative flippase GtrA
MQIISKVILKILDSIYPLFRAFLTKPAFHYLACGGSNSILDLAIFTIAYNCILKGNLLQIGIVSISPHIASMFLSLFITIPTGFFLSKYIVFQDFANNKIQLLKYIIIVILSLIANYILMKVFVEKLHITPLFSKICTTATIVIFSYLSQKKFAFKN